MPSYFKIDERIHIYVIPSYFKMDVRVHIQVQRQAERDKVIAGQKRAETEENTREW